MDDLEQLIGDEGVRVTLGEAKELISKRGSVYFGCRVCPFAHRSFWVAEELGYASTWKYVHIDLGKKKPAWYMEINPLGTVPCLYVDGKPVFESLIVAEYMNDVQKGSLVPSDPYTKATMRFIIARFDDTCKSAFYGVLMNKDQDKYNELAEALHTKLQAFEDLYKKSQTGKGPYFLGEQLSLAEIAIIPFLERFEHTLAFYRSINLFENGRYPTINAAVQAARARPAFRKTTAPKEYYVVAYRGYAGASLASPKPAGPASFSSVVLAAALVFVPLVATGLTGRN